MAIVDSEEGFGTLPRSTSPRGPVTSRRQLRTLMIYAAMCVVGLVPAVLGLSPFWQAAGLGLWMPGAGFVAVGGWAVVLFPLSLFLFGVSIVAWFWAGMVLAPATVWLGTALIAGAMATASGWPEAHIAVAALVALTGVGVQWSGAKRLQRRIAKGEERQAYVPASLGEVREMVAKTPDPSPRELSADQLESVRYILDRALQPVEQWNGFNIIDQFQPAALRYQINHLGFGLGILQGAYTPNFTGYLAEAQNNLIQKYLLRKVWGYWVYESCWGHLNFSNFDPAARDNIMLTGWFGMHVGQYMLNAGDRRYLEPGSLTFRLNERTAYAHDFNTLVGSVVENYDHYAKEFGLFPCEPNWIYPICNHYGMGSLAVHDAVTGSDYVKTHLPMWLDKLDTEFTDASGSIIGLRSKHTGIEFPFPVGEAGYSHFANIFSPERAQKLWATARKEVEPAIVTRDDGSEEIVLPGKGLDPGNYSPGFVAAFGGLMVAAREFGEERIAQAAQNSLDRQCGLSVVDGVRSYDTGSNIANANVAMGRIMQAGDFRRSFTQGPAEETRGGPVLARASYPHVLVARAYSTGTDLDLVLHPGSGETRQTLGLARLEPGRSYTVTGAAQGLLVADEQGTASLEVTLDGRTALHVSPA